MSVVAVHGLCLQLCCLTPWWCPHLQFDKDKSGTVSFKELFAGLGQVLGGTIDERAEFYFTYDTTCSFPTKRGSQWVAVHHTRLYDIDGSGAMSRDEVLAMVLSSQEAVEDSAVEVKKILDQVLLRRGVPFWLHAQMWALLGARCCHSWTRMAMDPSRARSSKLRHGTTRSCWSASVDCSV